MIQQRIYDYLTRNRVYFLSTVDGNCPRVRPFGSAYIKDGIVYYGVGTQKLTYAQLTVNPNIEICSYCQADGSWMRLRGKAKFVESQEINEAVFAERPHLKKIYNEETGYTMIRFCIIDGHVEFADTRGNFEQFDF